MAKGTLLARLRRLDGYRRRTGPGSYFWVELPDRGHERREGAPPSHLGRDLADRARRASASRRACATRPSSARSPSSRSGDEVEVEEPKGSFLLPEDTVAAVRVRRGRHRHHRLPLDAALHRRHGRCPYDVTLVYSNRDRELGRVPRRARRARARRSPACGVVLTMTDDDGWDGRAPPHRRGVPARAPRRPCSGYDASLVAGPPGMAKRGRSDAARAGISEEQIGQRHSSSGDREPRHRRPATQVDRRVSSYCSPIRSRRWACPVRAISTGVALARSAARRSARLPSRDRRACSRRGSPRRARGSGYVARAAAGAPIRASGSPDRRARSHRSVAAERPPSTASTSWFDESRLSARLRADVRDEPARRAAGRRASRTLFDGG